MKVRVLIRPSGLLNAKPWPEVGETIDLPFPVAEAMIANGDLEAVEKRPANTDKVETRTAKKAPAKKAAK